MQKLQRGDDKNIALGRYPDDQESNDSCPG